MLKGIRIMQVTIDKLKIVSMFLLVWYGVMRWIMLPATNQASVDWLADPFGNLLACISIIYLVYSIIIVNPQNSKIFMYCTFIILMCNIFCLYDMTKIFIFDCSPANFGYEMLDIGILTFYILMMLLCIITNRNSIFNCALKIPAVRCISKIFGEIELA